MSTTTQTPGGTSEARSPENGSSPTSPDLLKLVAETAAANRRLDGEEMTGTDGEGYVIQYASRLRVKIKYPAYLALHHVMTGVTERDLWQVLHDGGTAEDLDALLALLPDELHDWAVQTLMRLTLSSLSHSITIDTLYNEIRATTSTRKEFAAQAVQSEYRGILFALLDGKNVKPMVWDLVKPPARRPFERKA